MKMRRLFAGIAAAATLLGGIAFGGAANAADSGPTDVTADQTITLKAEKEDQLNNMNLKAYKLGKYQSYTSTKADGTEETTYTVVSADETTKNYLKTVAPFNENANAADPLQWALDQGRLDSSVLRTLANALTPTSLTEQTFDAKTALTSTAPNADGTYQRVLTLPAGYYLLVDSGTNASARIIVGTAQTGIANTGVVNFKNQSAEITKTVDKDHGRVGDTLTYTITVPVPDSSNGFPNKADGTAYSFAVTDYPSKGLTIDPSTAGNVTLGVRDKNAAPDATPTSITTGFTATTNADNNNATNNATINGTRTVGQDANVTTDKKLTVDATEWVKNTTDGAAAHQGGTLVLTVKATINAEVLSNGTSGVENLDNRATVDNNGASATAGTATAVYGFDFKKVDADGNDLAGASFKIGLKSADGSTTTYLSYDSTTKAWSDAASKDAATTFGGDAASGNPQANASSFSFQGLDKGTYVVEETTVPNGYVNAKASFEVTLGGTNGPQFKGTDVWKLAGNNGDTAAVAPQDGYTVKNVKSIAQLPLTGAAGVGLFTVVALLLAGAGVTVFAKSRSTKRALRA